MAKLRLEKTHKYYVITNSLNAMIVYHSVILPAGYSKHEFIKDDPGLKTIVPTTQEGAIGTWTGIDFETRRLKKLN